MTQGLRTVLKWLLFESHGTSRCLPYSAKVDHSRHGLGWNPYALNDLIWTFLYTYISFWWNNWLMSQILKDAFYILIVKFLSFQKKGQANPVALHSVLRGWRFTPGCFGGWRCCLGALWPTTKHPEILAEILEQVLDCWTLFVWLLNLLLRVFRLWDYLLHFIAGTFSPPPSPQNQGVLVVEISFQIRVLVQQKPTEMNHRFLSVPVKVAEMQRKAGWSVDVWEFLGWIFSGFKWRRLNWRRLCSSVTMSEYTKQGAWPKKTDWETSSDQKCARERSARFLLG